MTSQHPIALITGASSGIGEAFSRAFAKRGYDLVLVARSEAALNTLANTLEERHGVNCTVLPADLSVDGAGAALSEAIDAALPGRFVDVLVNNAGFGMYGDLATQDLNRALQQVRLNVLTLTDLTMRFLPKMVEVHHGAIINIASTAAFQPIPGMAIYAATKAYVRYLTEALWEEVRGTNVRVLTVCPGPTQTNFFHASGATVLGSHRTRLPAQVVDHTLQALRVGRVSIVDGTANAVVARVLTRLAPTRLLLAASAKAVGWTRQTVAANK